MLSSHNNFCTVRCGHARNTTYLWFVLMAAVCIASCKSENPSVAKKGKPEIEFPDSTDAHKLYGVKSGVVDMKVVTKRGSKETLGKTTQYFDEFGARQRISYSSPEFPELAEQVQIIADSAVVNYNTKSKSGMRFEGAMDINAQANIVVRALYFVDSLRSRQQLKQLPDRELLGRACKGYQIQTSANATYSAWIWKKIPLATVDATGSDTVTATVTHINTDTIISPTVFQVPTDIVLSKPYVPEKMPKQKLK